MAEKKAEEEQAISNRISSKIKTHKISLKSLISEKERELKMLKSLIESDFVEQSYSPEDNADLSMIKTVTRYLYHKF
jgi:hypothetical protein